MLLSAIANQFHRRMGSGRTKPCLLGCSTKLDEEIEVIVKFSGGCNRGVNDLIIESLTAMLAADLDLPIPEPFIVSLDRDFVDLIPDAEIQQLALNSSELCFGSKKLPAGFATLPTERRVTQSLVHQAADIFAFDALILNPDRRPNNPNCLSNGESYAIFDHELSMLTEGIIGWRPPWEVGALQHLTQPGQHVFTAELKGKTLNFQRFSGAFAAISDARLNEYREAIPPEWRADENVLDKALAYIGQLRDNIRPALTEVERVLK